LTKVLKCSSDQTSRLERFRIFSVSEAALFVPRSRKWQVRVLGAGRCDKMVGVIMTGLGSAAAVAVAELTLVTACGLAQPTWQGGGRQAAGEWRLATGE
jgi:hypothetical protein